MFDRKTYNLIDMSIRHILSDLSNLLSQLHSIFDVDNMVTTTELAKSVIELMSKFDSVRQQFKSEVFVDSANPSNSIYPTHDTNELSYIEWYANALDKYQRQYIVLWRNSNEDQKQNLLEITEIFQNINNILQLH